LDRKVISRVFIGLNLWTECEGTVWLCNPARKPKHSFETNSECSSYLSCCR
jgi:hypothetical protein